MVRTIILCPLRTLRLNLFYRKERKEFWMIRGSLISLSGGSLTAESVPDDPFRDGDRVPSDCMQALLPRSMLTCVRGKSC